MTTAVAVIGDLGLQVYKHLDAKVDRAEGDGLEARWEFGRALLRERVGKKLPKGRLAEVAGAIGKDEGEVSRRLAFASRYPDKGSFSHAVGKYRSWHSVCESLERKAEAHISQNTGESEWYNTVYVLWGERDNPTALWQVIPGKQPRPRPTDRADVCRRFRAWWICAERDAA